MHGIQDRLKALADETLLAPPASARQATLDAMAEAATASATASAAGTPGQRDAEQGPPSARSLWSSVQRRSGIRGISTLARAAVWVVLVGAAVTAGMIAIQGSSPAPEPGELAASLSPTSVANATDAAQVTGVTEARDAADMEAPTTATPETMAANEARESSEAMFELAVASAQLDLLLADLPRSRQVMRLGTAGTIIGLEDQIRLIDSEIERADAVAAPLEIRTALMRDRVDVLNALYYVRYAQSNAFAF